MRCFWSSSPVARALGVCLASLMLISGCSKESQKDNPLTQAPAIDAETSDGRPRWKHVLEMQSSNQWDTTPSGSHVLQLVENRLRVTLSRSGVTLFDVKVPFVADRVLAANGFALCYKHLDPNNRRLMLFDLTKRKWIVKEMPASIWNVNPVAQSSDIWVSTGDKHVQIVNFSLQSITRWSTKAHVTNIFPTENGCTVTSVLPTSIVHYNKSGSPMWTLEDETHGTVNRVLSSATSKFLIIESYKQASPDTHIFTSIDQQTGQPLWECTHTGKAILATIDTVESTLGVTVDMSRNGKSARLYTYDKNGTLGIANRGSTFFSPTLLCISDRGTRITVIDGTRGITTLSGNGSTLSRRVPFDLASTQVTRTKLASSGQFLFIHLASGRLMVYEAMHE